MVSPHHLLKIATALSAVALTASVAVAPAYALQDIAIEDAVAQSGSVTADNGVVMQSDDQSDDQTGGQQSQDSMPDNPNAKLPDNVSDEISDDATVVSEDLAVTPEGEVKNIETGEIVTDPTLVGTKDQQPDPLAKTNGESFIPVSAEDVKNAVADANDANSAESQSEQSDATVEQSVEQSSLKSAKSNTETAQSQSSQSNTKVQTTKFESNDYGAHWGTYNNSKAFFDYQNNLFVQQAKGVIDVSGWQGDIDWPKRKPTAWKARSSASATAKATMPTRKRNVTFPNARDLASRSASTGIPMRTLRRSPKKKVSTWSPNSSSLA